MYISLRKQFLNTLEEHVGVVRQSLPRIEILTTKYLHWRSTKDFARVAMCCRCRSCEASDKRNEMLAFYTQKSAWTAPK